MVCVQGVVKRVLPLLLALLAESCTGGDEPSPTEAPSSPPVTTTSSPVSSTTSPAPSPTNGEPLELEVWLTRGGKLFETTRTVPHTLAVGEASIEELLAGPTEAEADAHVGTRIEEGTELESITITRGIAFVEFTSHPEHDPISDAQVVYTLTQFQTVQSVQINEQEGGPLSREDLAQDVLPPIIVATPSIGDEVSSPVTVSGTADTFEAVVSFRILDEDGHKIAHTTVLASCGTGCRGDYTKDIEFSVDHTQPGTIVVYDVSEENGRAVAVQRIPVTLTA